MSEELKSETAAPATDPADADGDDSVNHQAGDTPAAAAPAVSSPAAAVPAVAPEAATAPPAVVAPVVPDAAAPSASDPSAPLGQGESVVSEMTEAEFDLEISGQAARVREAQSRVDAAIAECRLFTAMRDAVITAKAIKFPAPTPAETIQAHLKREQERREARVAAATTLNKAVGANVVGTKSPLDASIGGRRKPQALIPQSNRLS